VSDDREADDAAGDGEETTPTRGSRTAVATKPLRPTGKRSRQVAAEPEELTESTAVEEDAVEEDTKTKKAKAKPKTPKKTRRAAEDKGTRNPFAFVWNFLKQVVAELRKVIWPNRKQMVSYTAVVLVFLAFMVALISVVDIGLGWVALGVFSGDWAFK
jgi:preprotein translocase subunit SecE